MADYVKFQKAVEDIHRGRHDLAADVLKIALTNTAPNAATANVLADITEIAAGNGYTAGGVTVTVDSADQSAGVFQVRVTTDPTVSASGGTVGPFRYAVLYNSTPVGGLLLGYWDRGTNYTIPDGETFTIDVTDKVYEAT